MEKWFSISQLSEMLDIPETTARRYLNKFDKYFRFEQRGKGKKYHPESITILEKIALLYGEGYESIEIEKVLSDEFAFSVESEESKPSTQQPVLSIEKQFEEFKTQQQNFNKELIHELEKQQEYIKHSLEERDRKLMAALKEIQEAKQLAAATKQKKKSFWKLWSKKE